MLKSVGVLLLLMMLSACAALPERSARSEPVDERDAGRPVGVETAGGAEAAELKPIVSLLEDGQMAEARRRLDAAIAEGAGRNWAHGLREQLSADPEAFLGSDSIPHTVAPGESLSQLADRYLGDPLRFVILARYNGIARPRALEVGRVLRIPTRAWSGSAGPAVAAPGTDVLPASGALVRGRIESELEAGRYQSALDLIGRARAGQPEASWVGPLERRANALLWQQRGIDHMNAASTRGNEQAYEAFGRALALIPNLEPARRNRETLREALVSEYHRSAIIHYRNQRLDEALALWDRALALDPGFQPAQGYRSRALELKRRLRDLEPAQDAADPTS